MGLLSTYPVHKPLWIQERGFNHLSPRARRTGSTPSTKGSALAARPLGHRLHIGKFSEASYSDQEHFGEVGRVTSEPVWPHRKVLTVSAPAGLLTCLQQGNFWREFEEDFSASHLSIGGPVGPRRAGRKGPSSTICMFTLVCTPIISKQRQRKALGCS